MELTASLASMESDTLRGASLNHGPNAGNGPSSVDGSAVHWWDLV